MTDTQVETLSPGEEPNALVESSEALDAAEGPEEPSAAAQAIAAMGLTRMSLQELKEKPAADLVTFAEALEIENANSMLKQDMMFAILKSVAEEGVDITGSGTLEVLQDGFGFLRSPEANYLSGPDDIYVRPRRSAASACAPATRSRAAMRSPREGERYFALVKVDSINFENPGERPAQGAVRQPDPALSGRAADHGDRRPDPEGQAPAASSTSSPRSARASAA